jgi:hypothetical protein
MDDRVELLREYPDLPNMIGIPNMILYTKVIIIKVTQVKIKIFIGRTELICIKNRTSAKNPAVGGTGILLKNLKAKNNITRGI